MKPKRNGIVAENERDGREGRDGEKSRDRQATASAVSEGNEGREGCRATNKCAEQEKADNKIDLPAWIQAGSAVAIFLLTMVNVCVVALQYGDSHTTLSDYEGSLKASDAQFIEAQRPYIGFSGMNVTFGKNAVSADVVVQNLGKTPALHMSGRVGFFVTLPWNRPSHWQRIENALAGEPDAASGNSPVLAPNQTADEFVAEGPIPQMAIPELKTAAWAWVVVGTVTYTDRYRRHYWTEFCLYPNGQGKINYCPSHNASDYN